MQPRRGVIATVLVLASLALVIASMVVGGSTSSAPRSSEPAMQSRATDAAIEAKGGSAEAEEEAGQTAERIQAWHQAKAAGTLRVQQAAALAAPGWAGERSSAARPMTGSPRSRQTPTPRTSTC